MWSFSLDTRFSRPDCVSGLRHRDETLTPAERHDLLENPVDMESDTGTGFFFFFIWVQSGLINCGLNRWLRKKMAAHGKTVELWTSIAVDGGDCVNESVGWAARLFTPQAVPNCNVWRPFWGNGFEEQFLNPKTQNQCRFSDNIKWY